MDPIATSIKTKSYLTQILLSQTFEQDYEMYGSDLIVESLDPIMIPHFIFLCEFDCNLVLKNAKKLLEQLEKKDGNLKQDSSYLHLQKQYRQINHLLLNECFYLKHKELVMEYQLKDFSFYESLDEKKWHKEVQKTREDIILQLKKEALYQLRILELLQQKDLDMKRLVYSDSRSIAYLMEMYPALLSDITIRRNIQLFLQQYRKNKFHLLEELKQFLLFDPEWQLNHYCYQQIDQWMQKTFQYQKDSYQQKLICDQLLFCEDLTITFHQLSPYLVWNETLLFLLLEQVKFHLLSCFPHLEVRVSKIFDLFCEEVKHTDQDAYILLCNQYEYEIKEMFSLVKNESFYWNHLDRVQYYRLQYFDQYQWYRYQKKEEVSITLQQNLKSLYKISCQKWAVFLDPTLECEYYIKHEMISEAPFLKEILKKPKSLRWKT